MNTIDKIFGLIYVALAIAFVWRIFFNNKNTKKTIYFGFHIIYFALAIGFVWSFKTIIDIQYFNNQNCAAICDKIKPKSIKDYPKRGTIYCLDKNNEKVILSEDLPVYNIYFNGRHIHAIEKAIKDGDIIINKKKFKEGDNINDYFNALDSIKVLAGQLAKKFGSQAVGYAELMKAYKEKKTRARLLNTDIDFNIIKINEISDFALFNGRRKYSSCLVMVEKANRIMPFDNLAKRTIGIIDNEKQNGFYKGKYGLEAQFDSLMRGVAGEKQDLNISIEKTVTKIDPKKRKQKGADLTLTLDMEMQEIVTGYLIDGAKRARAKHACAILMEVETGAIKAMVNIVRTADGRYLEPDDTTGMNTAVRSNNELGSVFKIPSIMAAIENGFVTDTSLVYVRDSKYGNVKDYHKFSTDSASVTQIIAHSSNIGVANILCDAYYHKRKDFYEAITKLCFDAPINFDLPAPSPMIEKASSNFEKKVFGYVGVSPLYMLRFFNAIANNGKMINPFIVKNIEKNYRSLDGYPRKTGGKVADKICSESTLKSVQKMLVEVFNSGNAKKYKSKTVTLAGKTGTADIVEKNKKAATQGTFCGYFPAGKPKYSCIVMMNRKAETEEDNLFGAESCEVFKNIAEKIFSMENSINFSQMNDSVTYSPKNIYGKDKKINYLAKCLKIRN